MPVLEAERFGTTASRHLMLDPAYCIACGLCEQVCAWESIYPMAEEGGVAVLLVEDHTCTRCSACVEVCPTDCLYFARLDDEPGTTRTLGVVERVKGEQA